MTAKEKATQFHEKGYNCAQSVLVPFADVLGIAEETLFKMGANFGAGMRTGSVCGAVTGL